MSNLGRLFILLNITTMWGNIAINNAKVASSFKHGLLQVSSNVKLAWSLAWRLLMVPNLLPHHVVSSTLLDLNHNQTCWFLDYTTPKIFDKTNSVVYQSLMGTIIYMSSKSWIPHNCHLLYWLPHVRTNMPTFQIHFMSMLHACGLFGVLNLLYSQCCGMAIQKLNCSYRC